MRIVFMLAGLLFVGLGVIGVFLPVVPSTVFFIIAAVFFARSNPVWEAKIMNHPKIGPPIRRFRERGAIAKSAKIAAVTAMAISSVISAFLLHGWWRFAPAGVCALCAVFILTRPNE